MWPFGEKVASRLAGVRSGEGRSSAPAKVSVVTTIVSGGPVTSPVTGVRSAIIFLEVLERVAVTSGVGVEVDLGPGRESDRYETLGEVLLGDVATLRDEDGDEIAIVAGRARISPQLPRGGGTLLAQLPAELIPFARKATGRGALCYRELAFREGDKVRLRAVVEASASAAPMGSGSDAKRSYIVRDDLAPIVLEEMLAASSW